MRLNEDITVGEVSIHDLRVAPKEEEKAQGWLKLRCPLTPLLAALLEARPLLYEVVSGDERPRFGFKRLTLDRAPMTNVRLRVEDHGLLDVMPQYIKRWAVTIKNGHHVLHFDALCTGQAYLAQLGDFAAAVNTGEFTLRFSPIQEELNLDKSDHKPVRITAHVQ
jgi:hypothetical protein